MLKELVVLGALAFAVVGCSKGSDKECKHKECVCTDCACTCGTDSTKCCCHKECVKDSTNR